MNLLRLAPEVQERLLGLQDQRAVRFFSERRLRPLIPIEDPQRQMRELERMLGQIRPETVSQADAPTTQRSLEHVTDRSTC